MEFRLYNGEVGLVEYKDVSLVIPATSLDGEVTQVTITEVESQDLDEQAVNPIISPIYDFSIVREQEGIPEESHHAVFEDPYIAFIDYDESAIPEGFPEENLGVYYYNEEWSRWFLEESAGVDTENNRIIFATDHFSYFSVQPTVVNDISPQELRDIEYSPFSSNTLHAPVSVSTSGGTVSTSMTEFVLPGRDDFDFELRRIYDTGTARMDNSGLSLNYSINISLVGGALAVGGNALISAIGIAAEIENAIKQYFTSNGDFSYATGQGWRLNLPYIRGSNGGILARTPNGSFYDVHAMEKVSVVDLAVGRELVFENHENEDFTLKVIQTRSDINITSLIATGRLSVPGWALASAVMEMADGSQYHFDSLGRLTKIISSDGKNEITVNYKGLRLYSIVDSMGRIIRFEYELDLAKTLTIVPQIKRIWIENDPLSREVNYTYGSARSDSLPIPIPGKIPLLKKAVDVGGRSWTYDYDSRLLVATDFSFKVNVLALLLSVISGGVANEILSVLGISAFTVSGGVQAEIAFVMDEAQGHGIGTNFLQYRVQTLDYAKTELTDYFLGFIPTAIKTSIHVEQRLTAKSHRYFDPILNLSWTKNYQYSFDYSGIGSQFVPTFSKMEDGLIRENHYFSPITKTRSRFLSWSDVAAGFSLFQSTAYYQDVEEKIPLETKVETFDVATGALLHTTTTDYDKRTLRPLNTVFTYSDGNAKKSKFLYDSWGNIIYTKEESLGSTASYITETWKTYVGGTPTSAIEWPKNPLEKQTGFAHPIHNCLAGMAIRYTINDPELKKEPQIRYTYYTYDEIGQRISEAQLVSGEWAMSHYEYDDRTGVLSKMTNPIGAVTEYHWDYQTPGNTHSLSTIQKNVIEANDNVQDIKTIQTFQDAFGELKWEKDGRGYVTSYQYDKLGRKTRITYPDDDDDDQWNPYTAPTPDWRKDNPAVSIAYDDARLTVKTTDALGAKETYSFAHDGQMRQRTLLNRYGYNEEGTPFSKPQDITHQWTYDAYGRMIGYIDPNGLRIDFSYDALGRKTKEVHHLEENRTSQKTFTYSPSGNMQTIINELGHKTVEYYDMKEQLLARWQYASNNTILKNESSSYDALGNQVSSSDSYGHTQRTTYNERNQPVTITQPESAHFDGEKLQRTAPTIRYEYDAAGNKLGEYTSSRRGEDKKTYTVDQLGRILTESIHIKDDGKDGNAEKVYTTKHFYDANGNQIISEDPLGNQTQTTYTPRNQKALVTDANGMNTRFTYDAKDRQTSITDPRGTSGNYGDNFTIELTYDDKDRLIQGLLPSIEENGPRGEIKLSYDRRGNLLARIEPDGSRTLYTYSPRYWKLTETLQGSFLDGSQKRYTTSYQYDEAGRMIALKEPGGAITQMDYDAIGQVIQETLPDNSIRRYEWDLRGLLTKETDAHDSSRYYTYDELGRQTALQDEEGHITSTAYNQQGLITRTIDPSGEPFLSQYDERGFVTHETNSRGKERSFSYDDAGRLSSLIDARGTTIAYTYTPTNLIDTISYTNGEKTHLQTFAYDEAGALKEVNDNGIITQYNNKNSTYTPNPFNLNTAVDEQVNGSNLAIQYSYDIMQRLNAIGYSNNETVDYSYNTLGQIERIPGIIDESMSFDANGLLTGYQMTNGFASAFTYDAKRRVSSISHNGARNQPGQSYQFTYDKVDNIIEKSGEYFSYDRKGQMMSAVLTGEAAIEEYPLKSEEFSLGSVRSDIRGDEEVLIPSDTLTLDWGAGSLGINLGYAYKIKTIIIKPLDKTARIEKRKLQILTSLYNHEDTFKDQSFRMEQNDEDGTVTITLATGVFTRLVKIHSHINPLNSEGQPIPGGNFELDPKSVEVYALTGGKNEFYAYAPDGDRQQLTVLSSSMKTDSYGYYANSDLVKTVGNFAYRYDENGNLVEKGNTFTPEGEEITIQPKGDYYLYEYDLLNRLVSVSKPGEDGPLTVAVSYRYNHNNLRVERTDAEGTTRYVYDLDGNVLEEHRDGELIRYAYRKGKHLAKFTPNETYFYGTDHLGSTTVMTDSKGDVVWRGYISPFGDSATGEGSVEEAVKFTGKELDPETGLYYFNARWYDPVLGRFTMEDPARDGINWYVYVLNNPLKYNDPTGLIPNWIIGGIAGGIVSGIIDFGAQKADSLKNGTDFKWDKSQTATAVAGGVVAGVLTSGASAASSVLKGGAQVAGMTLGGGFAGGTGAAVTTISDNLTDGDENTSWNTNLGVRIAGGTIGGALLSGAASAGKVAMTKGLGNIPSKAPTKYVPPTAKSSINNVGKDLGLGLASKIISEGTIDAIETRQNNNIETTQNNNVDAVTGAAPSGYEEL